MSGADTSRTLVTATFAGRECRFQLRLGEMAELERLCGAGNQGVLGATVVLLLLLLVVAGLVIRTLYRDNQACHGVALEDRRDLIEAVEASRDMSERLRDLLQSMQATLETRGQTVSDLSHQVGITAQKVEHGLGNLGASLDAIARWIDRQRDRGEDRARQRADDLDRGRP